MLARRPDTDASAEVVLVMSWGRGEEGEGQQGAGSAIRNLKNQDRLKPTPTLFRFKNLSLDHSTPERFTGIKPGGFLAIQAEHVVQLTSSRDCPPLSSHRNSSATACRGDPSDETEGKGLVVTQMECTLTPYECPTCQCGLSYHFSSPSQLRRSERVCYQAQIPHCSWASVVRSP